MSTPKDTYRYSGGADRFWIHEPTLPPEDLMKAWKLAKPKVNVGIKTEELIILGTSGTKQNETKCKTGKKQSGKTDDI